jgi:hypothetical protein
VPILHATLPEGEHCVEVWQGCGASMNPKTEGGLTSSTLVAKALAIAMANTAMGSSQFFLIVFMI